MTVTRPGVFRAGDETNCIILDNTQFPLIFVRWLGDSSEKLVEDLWDMRNKTIDGHSTKRGVLIHLLDCNPPPATVRKRSADLSLEDPHIKDGTFISVMILKNPLLRGVVTAVLWMAGKENFPMEFASDIDEALVKARRLLEFADVTAPDVDASYKIDESKAVRWT